MKKIIGGKLYDTDTAQLIGDCNHNEYNDFCQHKDKLYKKKNGEYFLHMYDGYVYDDWFCNTYCEDFDINIFANSYLEKSKDRIFPITEKNAKKWVARYLSTDKYIELFGEVNE